MNSPLRNKLMVLVLLIIGISSIIDLTVSAATAYSIDVTYDPKQKTLVGVEEVTFTADSPTAYFFLLANLGQEENPFSSNRTIDDLYPQGFEPASTTVETVEMLRPQGDETLPFRFLSLPYALQTFSLQHTVLAVDLPAAQNQTITLRIRFSTLIPRTTAGDQGIEQEILTWRFGWYPLLAHDQPRWNEQNEILSSESAEGFPFEFSVADYSVTIALPASYTLVCGSDHIIEIEPKAENFKRYVAWNDSPTRTFAITIGPNYEYFALEDFPIPIKVFFLPGHEETARLFSTYAIDILADYQQRFGPYPHSSLTIVENPNRYGLSMAADGIVWLSDLFFSHRNVTVPGVLNRFCEFTLAHEIAHQWWGLSVGVDLNGQNWLSEGMAQYLAVSYFERRHGEFGPNIFVLKQDGILENFVRSQFGFLNLREHEIELPYIMNYEYGFDEAIIKPASEVRYENASVIRLYDKGYLVARTIAAAMGRERFETGLRTAGLEFRNKIIDVDELRMVLEKEAGYSLAHLFETWLASPGGVDYTVKIVSRKPTEIGHQTTVHVSRSGGAIQPVVIELVLVSGNMVRRQWDGVTDSATLTFETEEVVHRATIDPDHLLPDYNRLNNNSPTKLLTAISASTLPLDAYLIQPDLGSTGLSISFLNRLRVTIGQGIVSASIWEGRNHYSFLSAALKEGEVVGALGYTLTSFSQAKTGSPGIFWHPTRTITLSGHRIITTKEPFSYLHIGAAEYGPPGDNRVTTFALDLSPGAAGRATLSAFNEIRLFPRIYLQGTVTLGTGIGRVPSPLLFDLEELISFGRTIGGTWFKATFPGEHKLYGHLAVEFFSLGNESYNLANLVMLDKLGGRVFVAGGTSWTNFDEFGKTTPKVEAGVEGILDLSAIGGLLPLRVTVGFAMPILGNGEGVFYLELSME